jgi:phage gp36-like protein
VSINNGKSCQSDENKWDKAISDAQQEIDGLRKRAYRLRQAVEIFKANKRDGVQWPGEEKQDAATN